MQEFELLRLKLASLWTQILLTLYYLFKIGKEDLWYSLKDTVLLTENHSLWKCLLLNEQKLPVFQPSTCIPINAQKCSVCIHKQFVLLWTEVPSETGG